jgi:hypothetical protein
MSLEGVPVPFFWLYTRALGILIHAISLGSSSPDLPRSEQST